MPLHRPFRHAILVSCAAGIAWTGVVFGATGAIQLNVYDGPGTSTLVPSQALAFWVYVDDALVSPALFAGGHTMDGTVTWAGSSPATVRIVVVPDVSTTFFVGGISDGTSCFGTGCFPPFAGGTLPLTPNGTLFTEMHLATGMRITGTVTDGATGGGLQIGGAHVFQVAAPGADVGSAAVSAAHYSFVLPPEGPVKLGMLTGGQYVDEMWNNQPCPGGCPGPAYNQITVVPSTEVVADFALDPGALQFFTLSPCRALDTRLLADPLPSGTTRAYALGTGCGIPAGAVAIAVNVTVVAPPGAGSLALWASEATSVPTTVASVRAGVTRSNNAVVSVGHDISTGLNARLTMNPAGSAHLVIDVAGYFVRPAGGGARAAD